MLSFDYRIFEACKVVSIYFSVLRILLNMLAVGRTDNAENSLRIECFQKLHFGEIVPHPQFSEPRI